ncbi:type II toxin-antitoxin system HicA family toxin [Desulfohalovibrio reitneri]|uniref:type II toxin-antitoxin system HicA family toxin n=1 Tax=Desulfohalovibrio reitneri TaxID=1307759 RepID=UPI0004A72D32|nr:type II toxin-antitoxin system HicA family toxin [Desulfohalovibrio reitneri]
MHRLPAVDSAKLLKALKREGFEEHRSKGSHVHLKHPDGRSATIPRHSGEELGRDLLRRIMRQTGMTVEDMRACLRKDDSCGE